MSLSVTSLFLSPEDFRDAFCVAGDAFGRPGNGANVTKRCSIFYSVYTMFQKTGTFLFLQLPCVLLADLNDISQYCRKFNLQRDTHFKFYIDTWYLIVTQAENTLSRATVEINVTQKIRR